MYEPEAQGLLPLVQLERLADGIGQGTVSAGERHTFSVLGRAPAKGRPENNLGTAPIFVQRKWDCPLPKSGSCPSADPKRPDRSCQLAT